MPQHSHNTRLVCVQGTAQLLTALTALRCHDARSPHRIAYHDILLIYNLACPADSQQVFTACIKRLAESLHSWANIVSFSQEVLERLEKAEAEEAALTIQDAIGTANVDAVFMARDCGRGDSLVIRAVPAESRICYGDGIGFYAPAGYLMPKPRRPVIVGYRAELQRLWSTCRNMWRRRTDQSFDMGYFVVPSAVGFSPPFATHRIQRQHVESTYTNGAASLPRELVADLRDRLSGNSFSVLLTSTNSEWGRIGEDAELNAYREWIVDAVPKKTTLLLKTHPRESHSKLLKLESMLSLLGYHIVVPNPMVYGPIPAELLLKALLSDASMRLECVYTVSAAAIALSYLFDCEVRVGFGRRISKRWFSPHFTPTQLQQEAAITRSVGLLRSRRKQIYIWR